MEAVQRVKNVHPKFRCAAIGLLTIMFIGTFLHFIRSIFEILISRNKQPTDISFANAANGDVDFGAMPWMAIKLESFAEDFGPQFTKSKTSWDVLRNSDFRKKFTCWPSSESVCPDPNVSLVTTAKVHKPAQNNLIIVDMTHVEPHWSHNTPWVNLILHSNSTMPALTFFAGDADTLAEARATQNFDTLEDRFLGHAEGKLSDSNPGCIRMYIQMEKGFVPKKGTCWGFPWPFDVDCTQVQYTMVFSEFTQEEPVSDECESGQMVIQVIVRSFLVRTVAPHGIRQQLQDAFTNMGGSLALLTSVFLCVFVRQYPSSHDEQIGLALTLNGHNKEERPTFEEYDEMESAPESEADE